MSLNWLWRGLRTTRDILVTTATPLGQAIYGVGHAFLGSNPTATGLEALYNPAGTPAYATIPTPERSAQQGPLIPAEGGMSVALVLAGAYLLTSFVNKNRTVRHTYGSRRTRFTNIRRRRIFRRRRRR